MDATVELGHWRTANEGDMAEPVIDADQLGRKIRGARYAAGFERMPDLASAIEDQFGLVISSPTLYTYESGRTVPPVAVLLVLTAILEPPDGLAYLLRKATRQDVSDLVFGSP